eukprot:766174-Hanusia_phi.AAC.4
MQEEGSTAQRRIGGSVRIDSEHYSPPLPRKIAEPCKGASHNVEIKSNILVKQLHTDGINILRGEAVEIDRKLACLSASPSDPNPPPLLSSH